MRRPSPLIWILRALLAAPLLTDVIGGSRSGAPAGQPAALRFGMSRKLGLRVAGDEDDGRPFAGRGLGSQRPLVSDELARGADEEIRLLLDHGHEIAASLLDVHRETLERLSELLIEYETIEREDFERLVHEPTTSGQEPSSTTPSLDVG